jgi:hypothetical protein
LDSVISRFFHPLKNSIDMKANISIGECIIRIIGGVLFGAIVGSLFTGYVALLGVLAIYPLVTGLGGWDPIYAMMGKYSNEDNPYLDGAHGHNNNDRNSGGDLNQAA